MMHDMYILNDDPYENAYKEDLAHARVLLEHDSASEAKQLMEQYYGYPDKKKQIDTMFADYMLFRSFKSLYESGEYAQLYALVTRHESLKLSDIFKNIESKWDSTISAILHDMAAGNSQKHLFLSRLEHFASVPEKAPTIQFIVKQPSEFLEFHTAFEKKDFKTFFDIVGKFPELKKTKEYMGAIEYADTLMQAARHTLKLENLDKAQKFVKILLSFPTHFQEVEQLMQTLQNMQTVCYLSDDKHYEELFRLISEEPSLATMGRFQEELRQIDKTVTLALQLSEGGKIYEVMDILGELIKVKKYDETVRAICSKLMYHDFCKKLQMQGVTYRAILLMLKEYITVFGKNAYLEMMIDVAKRYGLPEIQIKEILSLTFQTAVKESMQNIKKLMPSWFEG